MSQNNTERGANPMTAPPAGALEACLALLEKATPGQWEVLGDNQGHPAGLEWTIEAPEIANEDDSGWIAGPHGGDGIATTGNPGCREDAEAMAAAVNFLRAHGPALLAALRLREWRPIAEAPKDGTRVLLWIKWSDEPVVGEFSHGRWWAGTEHHEVSCGTYCYGGSVTSDKSMEPILWRPIEPPTADDLARVLEESATGGEAGSG